MNLLRYRLDDGTLVEVTTHDVDRFLSSKNTTELAKFIHDRLYYRYIRPFEYKSNRKVDGRELYAYVYKNGFLVMASCCLLIETLESFYRGLNNTKGKSELLFLKFFGRDKFFSDFAVRDIPTQFYKSVRCGILHQGETTGGWKITREGNFLLNIEKKTINATYFLKALKRSIEEYERNLRSAEWGDEIWKLAIARVRAIIRASESNTDE